MKVVPRGAIWAWLSRIKALGGITENLAAGEVPPISDRFAPGRIIKKSTHAIRHQARHASRPAPKSLEAR